MLFSEPKIPQSADCPSFDTAIRRFSALQRAENSSIGRADQLRDVDARVSVLFSEPKIPQSAQRLRRLRKLRVSVLFSEPKIPQNVGDEFEHRLQRFQCSSASRKFLNRAIRVVRRSSLRFSALQRAENSSRRRGGCCGDNAAVSVLFSEPKIPQLLFLTLLPTLIECFSALQRAENSSSRRSAGVSDRFRVSVLFSEPKIPQATEVATPCRAAPVSVLFSEPKIPQFARCAYSFST